MTVAIALPVTTEVLSDRRDDGRALRVSWHAPDDMFVLSIWRNDRCTATFQLVRSDTPGLISCLVDGLATPAAPWSSATHVVAPTPLSRVQGQLAATRRWLATLAGRRSTR